ncbi:MAG: four-carbon acid sugar kinase family protein [Oxalobacteraceae bacterium]|nr:four-carbon acid sugar kinase family protein [Oxalobacteraceae bacterium]
MILGVIADDHTGATDVASMLVRSGLRTVQIIGVPCASTDAGEVDAVVIALKSRTIPPAEAIEQSLAALRWLQQRGVPRFYFKYCSTFDSTPQGNIGPVADALMQALGTHYSIACPAFPENQRTIFKGHLFVGDVLLSDSGMRNHPLTPMTDANLVRVLQAQSRCKVGLLSHLQVAKGAVSLKQVVEQKIATANNETLGVIDIADAITNDDLMVLGHALADVPLVTAGSGLALGLAAAYIDRGLVKADAHAAQLPAAGGKAVVISGSCSVATNAQVKHWIASSKPAMKIDAREIAGGQPVAQRVLDWHAQQKETCLIYATSPPEEVAALQKEFSANSLGEQIEHCFADIAQGLIAQQVRRFVVAGGETSGAVVNALGVQSLKIGETIDPGVPWTSGQVGKPLLDTAAPVLLALKSGNFGTEDFFAKALAMKVAQ